MRILICSLVAVLLSASFAQAGITAAFCAPDGDGAVVLDEENGYSWNTIGVNEYRMDMAGTQSNDVHDAAHMLGWFDTNEDPTVWIVQGLDNDTDFAWTGYELSVAMSVPFTFVSAFGPAGWSVTSPMPTPVYGTVPFEHTSVTEGYYATVTYTGGTPVDIGQSGVFGFVVNYNISGSAVVQFSTEQIPTPEPTSLLLLGLGGLVLIRRR